MPQDNQSNAVTDDSNPLIHWQGKGYDVYVGRETAKFYSKDEIIALAKHAGTHDGAPAVLLSHDDLRLIQSLEAGKPEQEIKSWLPPSFNLQPEDFKKIYSSVLLGISQNFPSNAKENDENRYNGGVIVAPGSELNPNFFRQGMKINLGDNLMGPSLMREFRLFLAAHEFTHLKAILSKASDLSFSKDESLKSKIEKIKVWASNASEINADAEAYSFAAQNPKLFPELSNPQKAQAIIGGWRALSYLAIDSSEKLDGHDGAAFYYPNVTNSAHHNGEEIIFYDSRMEVIKKVSELLIQQRLLKDPEVPSSITEDMFKRMKFDALADTDKPSVSLVDRGSSVDTTGVLKKYLKNLGVSDLNSETAKAALGMFQEHLAGLIVGGKVVESQLAFFRNLDIPASDIINLGKQIKSEAGSRLFESLLIKAIADQDICVNDTICGKGSPFIVKVTNPSNGTLNQFIATAEVLYKKGAFDDSLEQKHFVENLIAGGKFYLDPNALALARNAANKADARPKTEDSPNLKEVAIATRPAGYRPDYRRMKASDALTTQEPPSTLAPGATAPPAHMPKDMALQKPSSRTHAVTMGA